MGIRFRCHHCEHELNLKEFQAGRRARCPVCSGRFRVPTTSCDFSTPLESDEQELASTALRAADQPEAGRGQASPTFDLKQPSGDLDRFQRSPAETSPVPAEPARKPRPQSKKPAAPKTASTQASPSQTSSSQTSSSQTSSSQTSSSQTSSSQTLPSQPSTDKTGAADQAGAVPGAGEAMEAVKTPAPSGPVRNVDVRNVDARNVDAQSGAPQSTPAGAASAAPAAAATTPSVPRAIAEAPQAVWYVRPPSGGQFGPADSATFYQWMKENRVAREALVWRDGWPQWMIAGEAFEEYYGSRWLLPEGAETPAQQPEALAGNVRPGDAGTADVIATNIVTGGVRPDNVAGGASAVGGATLAGSPSSAEPAIGAGLASPLAPVATPGSPAPLRPLTRRKRRKTNYALGITVLAIVAIALVVVLVVVLMAQ